VLIRGDFQAGSLGISSSLTFKGTTEVSGVRAISIPNPDSRLILGGSVVATATDGITVKGAKAGDFKTERRKEGGVLQFSGDSPNFGGALNVASGTLKITATLGTKSQPVGSVTVEDGARLDGGGGKIWLPAGKSIDAKKGSFISGVGNSPGILEIGGGGVEFAALSGFGWQFDGPSAGNGDGFHSLLAVPDGIVALLNDAGQEPILEVDVLGVTSLPVVGETYTVIDINPDISRVIGDFMTSAGVDLPEGAKFFDDQGFQWQISYEGGPNHNDVVLTSLSLGSIPEPGALSIFLSGLLAWAATVAFRSRAPAASKAQTHKTGARLLKSHHRLAAGSANRTRLAHRRRRSTTRGSASVKIR
jgi:hypothetical protein